MPASEPNPTASEAFLTRNAVDCLPAGALAERLAGGGRLRVKLGMDPTAADVHLGHTVVLQKLREFQDAGHTVVLIIGDYTARVGDPSGRSSTRPLLSGEEIDANARTYVDQAAKVLRSDDPGLLEVRHNSEWLDMPTESLFGLVRHVTVAQVLEREDFARRWSAKEPISMLELLYPVLQGYDSVAVRADVELGGTDQTFNLLMGRAIQTAFGQRPQVVLTVPLLVGTDGERKMSKSLANHVGVADAGSEMFGRVLSLPDSAMAGWYDLLLGDQAPPQLGPREAKRTLARSLVERFAGPGKGEAAQAEFDRVFVAHEAPTELQEAVIACADGVVHLPEVIASAFGGSRSEARRSLAQGAVRLDGLPMDAEELDVACSRLDGAVLQVGRRRFRRLRVTT